MLEAIVYFDKSVWVQRGISIVKNICCPSKHPTEDSSQMPVTLAPGTHLTASSGLCGYLHTHVHIHTRRHKNKIKLLLSLFFSLVVVGFGLDLVFWQC